MPLPGNWTAHADRWFAPWVREVTRRTLRADALAGLVGALIVLPQGIAFATLAGLPPAWGIYTSILPCIVAALGGSSRLMVSGPSNATSLALAAMLMPLAAAGTPGYLQLALAATLGLGLLQAGLGLVRALLPRRSATLALLQEGTEVVAQVDLLPPSVRLPEAGDQRQSVV